MTTNRKPTRLVRGRTSRLGAAALGAAALVVVLFAAMVSLPATSQAQQAPEQDEPDPDAMTDDDGESYDEGHSDGPSVPATYEENLALLRSSTVRNTNHDGSPFRNTPMSDIVIENHLGSRSDYLGNPAGNPEQSFPVEGGGQFRTSCEFSHFAYDDPIVHPGQPGAAHLHMFWGNTDVNAYSTYDSLLNSGSSTCNGQELNRTGYWAPAMFDGNGNVRIPERIVVYYKGEGLANGASQVYPPGAAIIPEFDINTVADSVGGAQGKFSYKCSDQWSGAEDPQSNTIPECNGSKFYEEYGVLDDPHVVLEMNVKFPQCWNGADPSNPANYSIPDEGGWYYSLCPAGWVTLPNLEYFINYRVDVGENTRNWFLSSDVDPENFQMAVPGGASLHADWWGAWHPEVNQMWIDNCVNFSVPGEASGCGMGYLTNGGPDNENPLDGPALQFRPQYEGGMSIAALTLFRELCPSDRLVGGAMETAYCQPAGHNHEPAPTATVVPEPTVTVVPEPTVTVVPEPTATAELTPEPIATAVPEPEPDTPQLCLGRPITIVATPGVPVVGTDGDDVILGTPEADVIDGGAGDDRICGGDGADRIDGGLGSDVIRGEAGNDILLGEGGSDRIAGGLGDDLISGGPGADRLFGQSGNDVLRGGGENDWLFGSRGDDTIQGGAGDDKIRGGPGADNLMGSRGADSLWGGAGDDTLDGGRDQDRCRGGSGTDSARRCEDTRGVR